MYLHKTFYTVIVPRRFYWSIPLNPKKLSSRRYPSPVDERIHWSSPVINPKKVHVDVDSGVTRRTTLFQIPLTTHPPYSSSRYVSSPPSRSSPSQTRSLSKVKGLLVLLQHSPTHFEGDPCLDNLVSKDLNHEPHPPCLPQSVYFSLDLGSVPSRGRKEPRQRDRTGVVLVVLSRVGFQGGNKRILIEIYDSKY